MLYFILGLLALGYGVWRLISSGRGRLQKLPVPASGSRRGRIDKVKHVVSGLSGALGGIIPIAIGLFLLSSTSFVYIDANGVGTLKRIYAFNELPPGRIIALSGQKGPQAEILGQDRVALCRLSKRLSPPLRRSRSSWGSSRDWYRIQWSAAAVKAAWRAQRRSCRA